MRCQSAMVVDNLVGQILYERNAYERRPIASLTKLLTALVFLETGTDLMKTATINEEDALNSSKSQLRAGEEMTLKDFLHAALISSDNRAARVLARSTRLSPAAFITRMNSLARELGMDSTSVAEPTGLSEQNVATAYDCAILTNAALENHLIRQITTTPEFTLCPLNRKRVHKLVNTNRLLRYGREFLGSKTGYINESGWCIVARGHSSDAHDVTVVVLGAPSNSQRFRALENALTWAYRFPQRTLQKS
jgi:D-alanyl-D-alanine endopeptidase (penicillin-binding protein 7)